MQNYHLQPQQNNYSNSTQSRNLLGHQTISSVLRCLSAVCLGFNLINTHILTKKLHTHCTLLPFTTEGCTRSTAQCCCPGNVPTIWRMWLNTLCQVSQGGPSNSPFYLSLPSTNFKLNPGVRLPELSSDQLPKYTGLVPLTFYL